MYLSATLEGGTRTISGGSEYVSNGGSYWDAYTVANTFEPWFRTVYADDEPLTDYRLPGLIAINTKLTEPSTVIVEQQEQGPSGANDPISSGSFTTKAGEKVEEDIEVGAKYFRVRTINGDASNAGTLSQSIRMKDKYY